MKIQSARGIVLKDGRVLMVHRIKDGDEYYSIPGGKMDPGETLQETVVRELLEETCVDVLPQDILGSFETDDKIQHLYICKYIKGTVKLGDSVEKEKMSKDPSNFYDPVWISIADALESKVRPDVTENAFKAYLKKFI